MWYGSAVTTAARLSNHCKTETANTAADKKKSSGKGLLAGANDVLALPSHPENGEGKRKQISLDPLQSEFVHVRQGLGHDPDQGLKVNSSLSHY